MGALTDTQAGSTHRHPCTGALTDTHTREHTDTHAWEHSRTPTHGSTHRYTCTGVVIDIHSWTGALQTPTHGSTHRHPLTGALQTPTHGSTHRHPRRHIQAPTRRPPPAYLAGLELALGGLQASLQGGHAVQHRPALPLSAPRVLLLLHQLGLHPAQTPIHAAPGCGPNLARQAWPRPEPLEPWGLGVWTRGLPTEGSPGGDHLPPPWEEPKSEVRMLG